MSQFLLSFTGALFSPPAVLSASTPVSCDVTPRDVTLLRRMEPHSETGRWTDFRWIYDVTSRPCGRRVDRSSDRLTDDQRGQPTYSANRKIRARPAAGRSDQQQTGGQTSSRAVRPAAVPFTGQPGRPAVQRSASRPLPPPQTRRRRPPAAGPALGRRWSCWPARRR